MLWHSSLYNLTTQSGIAAVNTQDGVAIGSKQLEHTQPSREGYPAVVGVLTQGSARAG